MKKQKHRWSPLQGTNQSECWKCGCKKGYSRAYKRIVFVDRFGKLSYQTPNCYENV